MIKQATCVLAAGGMLLAGALPARAQMRDWQDRGFFNVNLGISQAHSFTESVSPAVYGEAAPTTVLHSIGSRPMFDISAGVRVWENFGVGLGYSHLSATETAPFTAVVPSPIVFGNARAAGGTTGELSHTENVLHAYRLWMMPASPQLHIAAILGASFFNVSHDLVSGITPSEGPPPFSTVTVSSVQTQSQAKTDPALTLGADAAYFFTPRAGAGGFLRYSRLSGGNTDLTSPTGSGKVSVGAGGLQIGFGLRVRF